MELYYFLIVVIAAVIHGSWNFLLKKSFNKAVTLWLGQLIGGFLFLPLAIFFNSFETPGINWYILVIVSGVIHALSLSILAKAYEEGELSLVLPVSRGIAILGSAIIAHVFLGERLKLVGYFGILVILTGILGLNLQTFPNKKYNFVLDAKLFSLAGILIAIYSTLDKYAVSQIPPLYYASMMSISTSLFWFPFILKRYKKKLLTFVVNGKLLSSLVGIGGIGSYCIVLFAFQEAPTVYVLSVSQLSIVIGVFLGTFFLGEKFTKKKFLYIILVITGAFLIKES